LGDDLASQQNKDDLAAVRTMAKALEGFESTDQERILRWVREKVGLPTGGPSPAEPARLAATPPATPAQHATGTNVSIKDFITSKNPRSDNQLAATVAYYYQFEAPESQRKETISADDLQEACRKAGRARLRQPSKTLLHAHGVGLLDKASDRGTYRINSVGENLVAMTLPGTAKKGKK
jgi:hypothetical protein